MADERMGFRERVMDAALTFDKVVGDGRAAWLVLCADHGDPTKAVVLSNMSDRTQVVYMLFDAIAGMGEAVVVEKPVSTTQ